MKCPRSILATQAMKCRCRPCARARRPPGHFRAISARSHDFRKADLKGSFRNAMTHRCAIGWGWRQGREGVAGSIQGSPLIIFAMNETGVGRCIGNLHSWCVASRPAQAHKHRRESACSLFCLRADNRLGAPGLLSRVTQLLVFGTGTLNLGCRLY